MNEDPPRSLRSHGMWKGLRKARIGKQRRHADEEDEPRAIYKLGTESMHRQ
jgi:hypothetical protein